jgi:predicted PurR-regulated permease PerM
MLGLDARIARYVWTAIFVGLLVGLIYLIAQTLFIFIVALLFAYMLWPLVSFLDQRLPGRSRVPALAIVYLILVAILVVVGFEVGSRIAVQANALAAKIPELLSTSANPPGPAGPIHAIMIRLISEIKQQIAAHSRELILLISNAILALLSHAEIVIFVILVPILSFFFLKDGRVLIASILGRFREGSRREMFKEITDDLHLLLAQYMRALVLLALAASIVYSSFLSLIGVPYGLLLGAIAFPFEFVPMVGPLASSAIILLVAGLSGFGHLLWILLFLIAFRLFQDYVLSPHLLSSGTKLHPLLVIFGVLAGGQIAGIAGSFLSVPIMAALRIVYRQMQKQRQW